jgi:uncharacterized protein
LGGGGVKNATIPVPQMISTKGQPFARERHCFDMTFYLPIAETAVNIFVYIGMGAAVGFLSGMFGVGGGFLITPLLMLTGIPSAVAVGTGSAQVVASSVSGTIAQYRRNNVDFKMGYVLLAGGIIGSVLGVELVRVLRRAGQFDLFVSLSYVVFLGSIGLLMLIESLAAIRKVRRGTASKRDRGHHNWIHSLPWKMRFTRSKLYMSVFPPLAIGAFVGLLSAVMGVGGGFVMVPAMIYLLKMPTAVVIGTSLFQIGCVTAITTVLQATNNYNVDVVLAFLLMVGAVAGAEFGASAGQHLRGEQLRFLLAALVLLVSARIGWDLIATPPDLFSITFGRGR